jgi:pimeloyl-ACP methyl ester carboxylesterase
MLVVMGVAGIFARWKSVRLADLEAGSGMVLLPEGVMEFAERGDDGPSVLVIHGAPGGYDQGLAYGAELLRRGCRVLAVSRPGYLRTPLETGLTPEEQADAIASLLRARGTGPCGVLGISEGSPCAVKLAARHPEAVSSLVLLSPPGESSCSKVISSLGYRLLHDLTGDLGCWWLALRARWDPVALAKDVAGTASSLPASRREFLAASSSDEAQRKFLGALALSITPLSPREHGIINDNAQLKDLPGPETPPLKVPLLVLRGENDSSTPLSSVQRRFGTGPEGGSAVGIIPNAGHIVPMGREFSQTWDRIASFLKSPPQVKGSTN